MALDEATEAYFAASLANAALQLQAAIQSATIAAQARTDSANIESKAAVDAAKLHANATVAAAQASAAATEAAANTQAAATRAAADIQASATLGSAQIQSAATTAAAQIHASATTAAAQVQANATTAAANTQADAEKFSATTRATADTQVATIKSESDVQQADIQADASKYGSQQNFEGTVYSSDQQLEGVEVRETGENTRLKVKLDWADGHWNQIFPYIQDALTGKKSVISGSDVRWESMLESVGQPPDITVGPVFTPAQIQQQLNMIYARTDTKVGSLTRTSELDLAGRGFSSDSPIMQAMRMGYEGYGIMAVADEEGKLRISTAQANADQLLKSESEAMDAHLKSLEAYTSLERNVVQLDVGVLGAAASLLAGVV